MTNQSKREDTWPFWPMFIAFLASFFWSICRAPGIPTLDGFVCGRLLLVGYALYWVRFLLARYLHEKRQTCIFYITLVLAFPAICEAITKPLATRDFTSFFIDHYIEGKSRYPVYARDAQTETNGVNFGVDELDANMFLDHIAEPARGSNEWSE